MTTTERLRTWSAITNGSYLQWFRCPKCNQEHSVGASTKWQRERTGWFWRVLQRERAERLRWRCSDCGAVWYTVTHEGRAHS